MWVRVCLCMDKRTEETKTEKERACVNIFKRSEQLGIDVKISGQSELGKAWQQTWQYLNTS